MSTVRISYAAAFVLLLCACASVAPPDQTLAYRSGQGVVEAVREARVALPPPGTAGTIAGSPSAGGSFNTATERLTRPKWVQGHQLTLRMDDGTVQRITQDNPDFKRGDRVEVTSTGRVINVAAMGGAASRAAGVPPAPAALPPAVSAAPAPAAAASAPMVRPGVGVVESVVLPVRSASTGASAASAPAPQEIRVRMGDGSVQSFEHNGPPFLLGEPIEVSADGRLHRR